MKKVLISILIFLIFFSLGASLRLMWFFTFQKRYLEYVWFEKPLAKMEGGANSPQEAWEKILSALERGDIEQYISYGWKDLSEGSDTENLKNYLNLLKEKGLLKKHIDCDKNLIFVEDVDLTKKYNEQYVKYAPPEKKFKVKCRAYKEIDLLVPDESTKLHFEKIWESKKNDVIEGWAYAIFKYNTQTKKWFLDSLDYDQIYTEE
jgi:hypothetical protein